MNTTKNGGPEVNYGPNSFGGPVQDEKQSWHQAPVTGTTGRYPFPKSDCDDFEQPRDLFMKVLSEAERGHLCMNIANDTKPVKPEIQKRMIKLFLRVHESYGGQIAKNLGIDVSTL